MNILYACDNKYVPIMGVSITSLFESNKDIDEIEVYVFGLQLSERNIVKIEDLAKTYGRRVTIIDPSSVNAFLEEVEAREWRGGWATWFRCFLTQLLPGVEDKILYIDCDTMVLGSLKELENTELEEGKALLMLEMGGDSNHKRCLGLTDKDPFGQAGVILFDLKRWREMGCEEKLVSVIKRYGREFSTVDQDAISCALHKYIQNNLSAKYNLMWEYDFPDPVIVHFVGKSIAELFLGKSNEERVLQWREFKDMSPWKNEMFMPEHISISGVKDSARFYLNNFAPRLAKVLFKLIYRERPGPEPIHNYDCETCKRDMPCLKKRGAEQI